MSYPFGRVSKAEYKAVIAKIRARKSKRAEKRIEVAQLAEIGGVPGPEPGQGASKEQLMGTGGPKRLKSNRSAKRGIKRKRLPSISKLNAVLWNETSLLVRSWSPICVACMTNATYSANHIVPSNDGAMTRFFLPNLYPGCSPCNESERRKRGRWVKRHEELFGKDFVDALYAMSEVEFQIKRHWLNEQIDRVRKLRGVRVLEG